MDTKEALKELEDLTVDYGDRNEEQIARLDEAIDMAIEALKTQADGDTISRRDAIDYCHQLINVEHQQGSDEMNYGRERVNQTETILHHLEIMPPAQPEKRTEERTETHACDCIERQAAIAYAISGRIRTLPTSEDGENWIRTEEVRQSLLNMPSAPQRTGRWIHDGCQFKGGIDWMHCSECGHKDIWNAVRTPFCAWCGARMDMKGADE